MKLTSSASQSELPLASVLAQGLGAVAVSVDVACPGGAHQSPDRKVLTGQNDGNMSARAPEVEDRSQGALARMEREKVDLKLLKGGPCVAKLSDFRL